MFQTYGTGLKGLKADDLERYGEIISALGMKVSESMVILSGIFFQIMKMFGLNETSQPEQLKAICCPDYVSEINDAILGKMEVGVPYAVRSSALSERGGTGIYHTSFFVPTGDRENDLLKLWEKEKEVYSSEFTSDARAWRKKQSGQIGMAILIQRVQGYKLKDNFLPSLAGTAYTSYQGLLTVNVVLGLGTKAVKGEGTIFSLPPKEFLRFQRIMWEQEKADAINLSTGEVVHISSHYEEIHCGINFKPFQELFQRLAELKSKGDFCLEWVITEKGIVVVQFAPYQDRLSGDMSLDKEKYFLLAQGSDVVNSGRAECKGIIRAHSWSDTTSQFVENLNEKLSGFLLIVPQDALSELAHEHRLGFRHFSNALAVIEEQWKTSENAWLVGYADHSSGRGASHFQQLCSRGDILFMGSQFDPTSLLSLKGAIEYDEGNILIWNTSAVVLIDGQQKQGFTYVEKEVKTNRWTSPQVCDWSDMLRTVANDIGDEQNGLAEHFYCVHYAIGDSGSPFSDPFQLDAEIVKDYGIDGIIRGIDAVSENIHLVPNGERMEFQEYLKELRSVLAK